MKKSHALWLAIIVILFSTRSFSQGLSFSYLIPKDGYLSAPVSPFSVRGLGLDFGLIEVETGFTLYSIGGLGMTDLPFEVNEPLMGPQFTVMVPLQLVLGLDSDYVSFKIAAGGFGFYHLNPRLNEGNLDRAIRDFEGWDVANSDLSADNKLGLGWIAGTHFEFHVSSKFSISAGVSYLKGQSDAALTGTYVGGSEQGTLETVDASFSEAKTNLEGIEISLGVVLNND